MSRENVELVRAAFEVWNLCDMDAAREMFSADATLQNQQDWPEPGPFVGREAVIGQLVQMRQTWDADTLEAVSDFFYAGDRVAVRFTWHGSGHGPQSNFEITGIYTVREGRLVGIEHFSHHGDGLEAVGRME